MRILIPILLLAACADSEPADPHELAPCGDGWARVNDTATCEIACQDLTPIADSAGESYASCGARTSCHPSHMATFDGVLGCCNLVHLADEPEPLVYFRACI